MEITITTYVYRERYPFGKFVHSILCRMLGEGRVFRYDLAVEDEIEIEATGDYTPGDPGNPSMNPERYDPPTYEEIENVAATCNGKPFELTADEEEVIKEELMEAGREEHYEAFCEPDYDDYFSSYDRDCDYWERTS